MTEENKTIPAAAAAAAMMKLTMAGLENHWGTLQPAFAAFVPDARLDREMEDELLQELYIAAISLELYDLNHVFDPATGREIEAEMTSIMQSGDFEPLQLLVPIQSEYLPRLWEMHREDHPDIGFSLIEEAAGILYERLPLPLKPDPAERGKNLLWIKLMQVLPQLVGKWPLIVKGLAAAPQQ